MNIRQLHPHFVGEVSDFDLTRPLGDARLRALIDAMDQYGILIFRNTGLTDETHIALSRQLGELELAPFFSLRRLRYPELFDAGNLGRDGSILQDERRQLYNKGNALWHTDSSFNPHRASYSLLLAHELPPVGGDTWFADMRAAYDALPDERKLEIEDLVVEHWLWHSRMLAGFPPPTEEEIAAKPPARHRLVQTHPGSGRKHLYIAAHAEHIVGWPKDKGLALIRELMDFATQDQFVYEAQWRQPGDLIIWDNRCTMHRATEFDDRTLRRDMRRTTVLE